MKTIRNEMQSFYDDVADRLAPHNTTVLQQTWDPHDPHHTPKRCGVAA